MAKILCIDDDIDVLNVCKMTLEDAGHTVETAINGDEGFEKAKKFKPNMIVLDVMMQHSTEGFHTSYKFRHDDELKYTPILMLTSVNEKLNFNFHPDKDGEFIPVDSFIEKPVSPDDLIKTTDKLLSLKKEEINVHGKKKIV